MARFTTAGGEGSGAPGPQGPAGNDGADGQDALWNFLGEYNNGADYAIGDVVTYDGGTYYRVGEPNPGYPPGTSYWTTVAEPGTNGTNGTNGADFGIYYLGNYVSTNGYITDIAVVRGSDGQLYLAKASGQLGDPVEYQSNGQWEIWIPKGADGAQGEPGLDAEVVEEVSFTVNGGALGTQPTFDGAPLFSGSYVKTGPMVHFQIQVDMDNITDFGTGQYYVDLPFPAKYGYQVKQGCLHDDSSGKQYAIGGHVFAGQSTLALTFTNSAGQDEAFDHNSPVTLTVADNFHIAGTYISQ